MLLHSRQVPAGNRISSDQAGQTRICLITDLPAGKKISGQETPRAVRTSPGMPLPVRILIAAVLALPLLMLLAGLAFAILNKKKGRTRDLGRER